MLQPVTCLSIADDIVFWQWKHDHHCCTILKLWLKMQWCLMQQIPVAWFIVIRAEVLWLWNVPDEISRCYSCKVLIDLNNHSIRYKFQTRRLHKETWFLFFAVIFIGNINNMFKWWQTASYLIILLLLWN